MASAILSDFLGVKIRRHYRDKSFDRPRRYYKSDAWHHLGVTNANGLCLKKDATHADLYMKVAPWTERCNNRDGRGKARADIRQEAINYLKCARVLFKKLNNNEIG